MTIPFYSTLFGILLPSDNFKYIPLWAFPNLVIEIRLNPYAFYTSGYKRVLNEEMTSNVFVNSIG